MSDLPVKRWIFWIRICKVFVRLFFFDWSVCDFDAILTPAQCHPASMHWPQWQWRTWSNRTLTYLRNICPGSQKDWVSGLSSCIVFELNESSVRWLLRITSPIFPHVICRSHIWGFMHWNGWTGFTHGRHLAGRVDLFGRSYKSQTPSGVFIICYRNETCNLMCFFIQAAISIFGIIGGPLLGVFTLGILCPFANSKVSRSSFNCSFFVVIVIPVMQATIKKEL